MYTQPGKKSRFIFRLFSTSNAPTASSAAKEAGVTLDAPSQATSPTQPVGTGLPDGPSDSSSAPVGVDAHIDPNPNETMTPADKAALEMAKLFGVKDYPGVESEVGVDAQKNAVSEETTVTIKSGPTAITERNREKNTLAYTLATNVRQISDMEPVSRLTGRELNSRGTNISDQITSFFKAIGNKIFRAGLGDVEFGTYGVDSVINHKPVNRAKIVSVAAAPDVIKYGREIGYYPNWKGRGYPSYIFAAPVTVNGTEVYVAAVVNKNPNNKFYLSEMVDSQGNYIRIEESPSGNSKNGVTDGARDSGKAGVTAGPEGLSEGGNPSAEKTKPMHSFNSSIRHLEQNVNPEDSVGTANPSVGAADAGFTGLADYDALLSDDNVQPARSTDAKHEEVPVRDSMGRAPVGVDAHIDPNPNETMNPAERGALELARLLEIPNHPGLESKIDTELQTDYDKTNKQGGTPYGAEQTYDDGRAESNAPESSGRGRETDADRPGIQSVVGETGARSPEIHLPGVQHKEPGSLTEDFFDSDYITPEAGSPLRDVTEEFHHSGIPCRIVKSASWTEANSAYARNGIVYISDSIDSATLPTVFSHEKNT